MEQPAELLALRWAVAAVLGGQAVHLLASAPPPVLLALAAAEVAAALLFAIPATTRLGSWSLLLVLACATGLHLLSGESPPLPFLVYAAAIVVVTRATPRAAPGAPA
jgi:hypothetical protein